MSRSNSCSVCHRALKSPASQEIGIGPVCAKKNLIRTMPNGRIEGEFSDKYLFLDKLRDGIIIRRTEKGVETNIPHLHTHHSPTGFEYGYGGSGPADLALNLAVAMLHQMGYNGPKTEGFPLWDKSICFELAYEVHQDLKWEFIAPLDRNQNHVIPFETLETWLKERITKFEAFNIEQEI